MATQRLSTATFVKRGYGQVEINHAAFQRNGRIYAQLPAASDIDVLENGQFAKYNMAAGEVNFEGDTEWLMVFNEVKLYRDREQYEDFAMIKQNYNARVYSPVGQDDSTLTTLVDMAGEAYREGDTTAYAVQTGTFNYPEAMADGTKMVPRLVQIAKGDIYTTNCVKETSLAVGDKLYVGEDGFLAKTGDEEGPCLQVVKVYTLADNQPAVKLQCIA